MDIMSAGVQTYRILVGSPMVRRTLGPGGWYVAIQYADGEVTRLASTQAEAMELGRAAVRAARFCRCTPDGPIFMRTEGRSLRSIHGGDRGVTTHIELRNGKVVVP